MAEICRLSLLCRFVAFLVGEAGALVGGASAEFVFDEVGDVFVAEPGAVGASPTAFGCCLIAWGYFARKTFDDQVGA